MPAYGDHIRVKRRIGYYHHGIYVGRDKVIHFTGTPFAKRDARVKRDSIWTFAGDGDVEVVDWYESDVTPQTVVRRAKRRLGERGYWVHINNCEHFAYWCRTGEERSDQVDAAIDIAKTAVTTAIRGALPLIIAAARR